MSHFPPFIFTILSDVAAIVLLAVLSAVLAAKAGWKGMPVAALAISCVKALILAINLIMTFGVRNFREPPVAKLAYGVLSLVNALSFLASLALVGIYFSLSAKAKAKAPYVLGGVGSALGVLAALPSMLSWTPIGRALIGIYPYVPYLKYPLAVILIVALVLALSMKAEDAAKE